MFFFFRVGSGTGSFLHGQIRIRFLICRVGSGSDFTVGSDPDQVFSSGSDLDELFFSLGSDPDQVFFL